MEFSGFTETLYLM